MSKEAKVWIEKNAYKISGEFHTIERNLPIRKENGQLCGVTNPRRVVHIHSYGGEWEFFDGLTKGKLLATRCDNPKCESKGGVYLPFRVYCPDCLSKATTIDVTELAGKTGKIYSYIVTSRTGAFNTLEIPIKFIDVEIQGIATILKSYLLKGEPKIGLEVVPIFRTQAPTFTITDLAFVEKGAKGADLPKGFTF